MPLQYGSNVFIGALGYVFRLIWKNTMKSSPMRHVHFLFYYDIILALAFWDRGE